MNGGRHVQGEPTVASVDPESGGRQERHPVGDVITAIDDQSVGTHSQLQHQLGDKYDGDSIKVTVERGGRRSRCENVTLAGS